MGRCVTDGLDFFEDTGAMRLGVALATDSGLEFVDDTETESGGRRLRLHVEALEGVLGAGVTVDTAVRSERCGRIVHLRGRIAKSAAFASPQTLLTLPAGHRPAQALIFAAPNYSTTSAAWHISDAFFEVTADGVVQIFGAQTAGGISVADLASISFVATAT